MLKKIIIFKVYYDRSAQYINYVKTLLGLVMFYGIFADRKIGIWMYDHRFFLIPVILISYIIIRFVAGWLDFKYKVREYEIGEYNKTDPNIQRIHRSLNEIKKLLNDNSTDSVPPRP